MRSYGQYCPVAKALDVIGDREPADHQGLLLHGPCRYTDLRNGLPGIATNLLSAVPRELEAAGLIRREEAAPRGGNDAGPLTEAGAGLEVALEALWDVGDQVHDPARRRRRLPQPLVRLPDRAVLHDAEPDGPPFVIELRPGGRPAVVEVSGGEVRARLATRHPQPGPGGVPRLILGLLAASSPGRGP